MDIREKKICVKLILQLIFGYVDTENVQMKKKTKVLRMCALNLLLFLYSPCLSLVAQEKNNNNYCANRGKQKKSQTNKTTARIKRDRAGKPLPTHCKRDDLSWTNTEFIHSREEKKYATKINFHFISSNC